MRGEVKREARVAETMYGLRTESGGKEAIAAKARFLLSDLRFIFKASLLCSS